MEMPIVVIVTFVVCLAVGGAVIFFAQDMLFHGKQNINDYGKQTGELGEKIINVNSPDADSVKSLAMQCAKDSFGEVSREICYVIKGTGVSAATGGLDNTLVEANGINYTIDVVGTVPVGANALFIYYNPIGTIEIVS